MFHGQRLFYMCYSRAHFDERAVQTDGQGRERMSGISRAPTAYILRVLFQGPLGERAVQTVG